MKNIDSEYNDSSFGSHSIRDGFTSVIIHLIGYDKMHMIAFSPSFLAKGIYNLPVSQFPQ